MNDFSFYLTKIKNGKRLNERDGDVLSYYGLDGLGMLYKRLGIQKNSANDLYLQELILNESYINAQLNGKSFLLTPYGMQNINPIEFVTPKGTKARENTLEFLRKRLEINQSISNIKNLNKQNLLSATKYSKKFNFSGKTLDDIINKNKKFCDLINLENLEEKLTNSYEDILIRKKINKILIYFLQIFLNVLLHILRHLSQTNQGIYNLLQIFHMH